MLSKYHDLYGSMARNFRMGADQVRRLLPRDAAAMLGIGTNDPAEEAAPPAGLGSTPEWLRDALIDTREEGDEVVAAASEASQEPAQDADPREARTPDEEKAFAREQIRFLTGGAG